MGGSSPTTGYKYFMDLHFIVGLARGGSAPSSAVKDGLLGIVGADRNAWSGLRTENGSIYINAPELFGGDQKEGGLIGPAEVLFGGPDQLPNAYLTMQQGGTQPAYRNVFSVIYKQGQVACNNPYIKPWSFLRRRITGDWYGGECWYEEKAPIPLAEGEDAGSETGVDASVLLFTGNAKETGGPVFAALVPGTAEFIGLDPATGADLQGGVAAYRGGVHVVVATDGCRYSIDNRKTWLTGTVPWALGTQPNRIVPGIDGWMALNTYYGAHYAAPMIPDAFSSRSHGGSLELAFVGGEVHSASWYTDYRVASVFGAWTATSMGKTMLDMCEWKGDRYAILSWGFFGHAGDTLYHNICKWDAGTGTWGEPLLSVAHAAPHAPIQLCPAGEDLVAYAFGGGVWTSADDWAEWHTDGLSGAVGPSYLPDGGDNRQIKDGRQIVFWDNKVYTIGSSDKCAISSNGGLSFDQVGTLPIAAVRSVTVSDPLPGEPGGEGGAQARYCMNPAHVIYQVLTDPDVGMGYPSAVIDEETFIAAADRLYAEGLGVNLRWTHPTSIEEFIGIVLDHAGAVLVKDRRSGLFKLRLLRKDYDIEDLPVFGPHNCRISGSAQRPTPADSVNELQVTYTDYRDGKEKAVPVRNAAAIAAAGGVVTSKTHSLTGLPTARLAQRCGLRDLDAMSLPLWRFELTFLRDADTLEPGQPFLLDWPPLGIQVVMRVAGDIDYGSAANGDIKATCIEDVFSLPDAVYSGTLPPPNTGDPGEPEPIVLQRVFEAPYINAVTMMPASEFAALPPDAGYVVGVAADPGQNRDFTMLVAPLGGDYEDVGNGDFCPSCTSTGLVEPGLQSGVGFSGGKLMADVEVGDLCLWDNELVRVDAIDLDAGTLDLGRGCGDTLPEQHAAGSRLYFYQRSAAYDRTQHMAGETVNVKLLTNSFSEQLDPADATAVDVTFAERIACPYPPGDYRINGVSIYAVGSATPGGGVGGGTGSGSVPTTPPAYTPDGTPSSPSPGPNGGYPDSGPYPVPPVPDYGDDLIPTVGDFDSASDLNAWRLFGGDALPAEWSISGGYLRYYGAGDTAAYCYPARFSLPLDEIRYSAVVRATVQSEPGLPIAVGYAMGFSSSSGGLPLQRNHTPLRDYPVETTIEYATVISAGSGLSIINLLPILVVGASDVGIANARFTNVEFIVEPVDVPATTQVLDHLAFDSGLTGWTRIPALDPGDATIGTAGGVLSFEPEAANGTYTHFVCDDPIDLADEIGKVIKISGEVWSNDPTVFAGRTVNGVALGVTSKVGGVYNYNPNLATGYLRGDFTLRRTVSRINTLDPGMTWHLVVSMRAALGYRAKVRNLAVAVTDAVVD